MNEYKNLKILAIVGLTGSGKSTAVDYFTEKGFPKVYFGGVIYEAMKEAGVPIGEEHEKTFRLELRAKEGNDFVAQRIVKQIRSLADAGQHRIIADGIYTWDEYKVMKHEFPGELIVVATVTPKHLRYHRLSTRTERPQTELISSQRDYAEIETMQKGGPIAMADYYVTNDGDLEKFHRQLDEIARAVAFEA